jgi:hypothetical protein
MALSFLDPKSLLFIQLIPTVMMTGVIWMVQVVQYPLFKVLDSVDLVPFHTEYSMRITWVVLPLMFAELILSGLLAYSEVSLINVGLLGLVLLIWAATFFVSVPLHEQLSSGSMAIRDALVNTNWIRTILWSIRTIVLTYLAFRAQ